MVTELYARIAEYHGITVPELRRRIVNGETLVHQYWCSL